MNRKRIYRTRISKIQYAKKIAKYRRSMGKKWPKLFRIHDLNNIRLYRSLHRTPYSYVKSVKGSFDEHDIGGKKFARNKNSLVDSASL